jgi:hypothetical protein
MKAQANEGKTLTSVTLLKAIVETARGSRQFCTPGHRNGKAYGMYVTALIQHGYEMEFRRKFDER